MSFHTLEEARPIIHQALDAGIRAFDTADLYDRGENERILGKLLAERRQEVWLATKVGNRWRPDGSGWDWVPRKAYILEAVPRSLQRLRTDYVDLLQLHGGTIEDPLEEVLEAFEILRDKGMIRAYGISSIRPNTIRKWTSLAPRAVSCMTQYSLLDRRPEEETLSQLHSHGQRAIVRGALAKGLLAAKPPVAYLEHSAVELAELQGVLREIVGVDNMAGAALHFVLHHPAVATVALGASSAEQLTDALAAYQRLSWTTELQQSLADRFPVHTYNAHR
jgi:aryl-alcohol dehydrogenase-like predicted oxidoreductase